MEVLSDLEIQFSPSHWSKRYDAKGVVDSHVEFAKEESKKVKDRIPSQLDISYGTLETQKYDLFGTDLPDDAPIFVFVHGGYWQELNKDLSSYVVPSLYARRIKSVIVDYTLCPHTSLEGIVEEVENVFMHVTNYAINMQSSGIHLAGHSAGAHLISCLLRNSLINLKKEQMSCVKSMTLISGIYDLTQLTKTYINNPLKLDETAALKLSPLYFNYLEKQYDLKINIVVGENESAEFKKQSLQYYYKLKYFTDAVKFIEVKNVDHFDIVENFNDTCYELLDIII